MGLTSNGGLPVVVADARLERSAATGAYLHTADGNTMAESRCTLKQFRL